MAKNKVTRRKDKTITRSGVPKLEWDKDSTVDDTRYWLQQAVLGNPDLISDMDIIGDWLFKGDALAATEAAGSAPPPPIVQYIVEFLSRRYLNIWQYPPFMSRSAAYTALFNLLLSGDWKEAGKLLLDRTVHPQLILQFPVGAEVRRGGYASPFSSFGVNYMPREFDSATVPSLAKDPPGLGLNIAAQNPPCLKLFERLCKDDGWVAINEPLVNPVFILEGRPGYSRQDAHDALDRMLDELEKGPPDYCATDRRGTNPKWRHLPDLYRFWREHPTSTPVRPDLTAGKTLLSWAEFIQEIGKSPVYPAHWKRDREGAPDTSDSTVENETKEAIRWLSPDPNVSMDPFNRPQ